MMRRKSGRKEVGTGDGTALELLVADIAKGDRGAFAELYRVTAPQLFGLALRLLRRHDWAEECLHAAYLRLWQEAGGYEARGKGPAIGWMATILRNVALERLRRHRRDAAAGHDGQEEEATLDEVAASLARMEAMSAGSRALARSLQQVELEPRTLVALAYWEGASLDELARRSGWPAATVKTAVRRALQQLKESLPG